MAHIASRTETAYATGTSYTVTLGKHVTGDLLLVCISNDGGGTTIAGDAAAVTAGWALIGTQSANAGVRQVWFWVIATSDSMANPVFTVATQGTSATCLVVKEAHATPIGGNMRSDWTTANTAASNTVAYSSAGGTTVITPAADSLMLYSWCCDGSGRFMRAKLNDLICDSHRAYTGVTADTISHIIGHVQLNSASCPDVTMYADVATEGGNGWVIEIKNVASGTLQKQARATVDETGTASNWYGTLGAQHSAVTWNKPSTFVAAAGGAQTVTINGVAITLSDTALGTVTSNVIQDSPWGSLSYIPNSDNANVLAGAWHTITSSNLDGKIFSFQWNNAVGSSSGRINTEGTLVGFASSDGNYAFYQVATKANGWLAGQVRTAIIDLNNATLIASAGTIDWTAVIRVGYFWHRASGSASTDNLGIQNACILTSAAITGGSLTDPANFQVAADDLTSWGHKLICEQQASAQVLAKFPLQIGDDTNYTYFDSSASSLEFPKAFSATQKSWNINTNRIGLTILAKDGDTVIMAAGVVASETAQALTVSASSAAQADATYSFAGESIVGLTPTDSKGLSWSNTTFKSGGTVTLAGGADLTDCAITKTTSTNAALAVTANGSVLDSTTIDGTGAAYALELGTSVTAITLTDCTLTAGSTDKVHVLATTGTVTITISGTTSLVAGDVTSAGATVAIVSDPVNQSVVVSGFTANSRLQIYDVDYNFTVTGVSVYPVAGETYEDPYGVVFTVISAGAGAVHAYGVTSPKLTGTLTLTKTSAGTGDATITYTACSDDGTELFNGTATAGDTVVSGSTATWTDSAAATSARYIRLRRSYVTASTASNFLEQIIGTCGITSGTENISYLDSPSTDTSYELNGIDGSGVTTVTFTDAATDLVNCNVPGGSITWQSIYAAFVYYFFTATGIADDIAYAESPDVANYLFTSTKLKNTSTGPVVPLMVTGGWGRDKITGLSSDIVDTSGGSIFLSPDHVVAYATGSGALTAGDITNIWSAATRTITTTIPTANDNATAAITAGVLTVPKFLGLK